MEKIALKTNYTKMYFHQIRQSMYMDKADWYKYYWSGINCILQLRSLINCMKIIKNKFILT